MVLQEEGEVVAAACGWRLFRVCAFCAHAALYMSATSRFDVDDTLPAYYVRTLSHPLHVLSHLPDLWAP